MAPQHTTDEADIRQRVERYAAAIRAKDLDAVMAIFVPDLVSFDLEAPLKHVGAEAKRRNWTRAFAATRHRSATRSATSRLRSATASPSGTASTGSAAR